LSNAENGGFLKVSLVHWTPQKTYYCLNSSERLIGIAGNRLSQLEVDVSEATTTYILSV